MIDGYLNKLTDTLDKISREDIQKVSEIIEDCKGQIFVFGNGGSATTASHFAQDMNKCVDSRFICLNDNVASILAYANDSDFKNIFKLQLSKLIKPNDLVIGISCSGNSYNIIEAIVYAKHFGHPTISLTGFGGGQLKGLTEYNIHVPCNDMQICEDCHLIITHIIMKLLQ
ncbi:MAG: SIS domain-containing protein [Bacteroidales bacterium]